MILFILLSTMNVNIVTVSISGGDMDAIISFKRVVFDKCFTTELHIMEQKPHQAKLKKNNNTPAPPDQEEEKEKSSLKHPDWLQCFCCSGINVPVPMLAILHVKFSLALS